MIAGIFHSGSGLGNQLHRYVATRVLALDKGYEWGMVNHGNFKGEDFMKVDKGYWDIPFGYLYWDEKKVVEGGVDIRGYDPEINFVKGNTVIDGEFQDSRYFEHRMNEVREWLKVEPLQMPDDLCIINFRGGEFKYVPDLFLPITYWNEAIERMLKINPQMRFEVHTDDIEEAQKFFDYPCIHDMGLNWRSIRYAKYLILSNSSFAILPTLLNQSLKAKPIAPRYWARRNTKVWALPQNYYKQFIYI